ncbi:hypothetical protein F4809DRAFT_559934 [Biscogniauxia mediterranea]|nr:hypothetical protein F4809DRAFT_559934 [Biscogniauxia mediterranea]
MRLLIQPQLSHLVGAATRGSIPPLSLLGLCAMSRGFLNEGLKQYRFGLRTEISTSSPLAGRRMNGINLALQLIFTPPKPCEPIWLQGNKEKLGYVGHLALKAVQTIKSSDFSCTCFNQVRFRILPTLTPGIYRLERRLWRLPLILLHKYLLAFE